MNVNVIEEKENPFFERKELKIELDHPGESTPKKDSLVKALASKYNVDENCIAIDNIFTKKGIAKSTAKVKIYKKPIEKPKEEKKPEEKPKPEEKKPDKKEEKPKEEKKTTGEKVEAQTDKTK